MLLFDNLSLDLQIINCAFSRIEVACEDVVAERNRLEKQRVENEAMANGDPAGAESPDLPDSLADLEESGEVVYPLVLHLVKDALVEIDKKNLTSTTLSALENRANLLQRDCYLVFR